MTSDGQNGARGGGEMLAKADAVVDRTSHDGHGVPMLWRASVVRGVSADGEVMRVAK